MDAVFKALSDPTRRALLDLLRKKDGQTVSELVDQTDLTRFGVMKHLKVLEEASLVTTRKTGRFKHLYLNAMPIQHLADRWIAPYVQPHARALADLKTHLEQETAMSHPDFVLETYIRTTPERLWQALTDPEQTKIYYFNSAVKSDWTVGSPIQYLWPDNQLMLDGTILEIDPPKKLVTSFIPHFTEKPGPETKVTYEIDQQGPVCKVTLIHETAEGVPQGIQSGWMKIMNGLKTLLETGEPLGLQAG